MSQEGCKLWASLSDSDHKLILEQDSTSTSTLMDSFNHSQGGENGHSHGNFGCQHDE